MSMRKPEDIGGVLRLRVASGSDSGQRRAALMSFLAVWLGVAAVGSAQTRTEDASIGIRQHEPGRDFIYREGPEYSNYGLEDFRIPETSAYARRNYYGPLGNFLLNGYDLYTWRETRTTTSLGFANSLVEKPGRFNLFHWNAVASESYKGCAHR
ncbi:MAG: hypothetical protein CMI67_25400 [Pelagibaca sp.]|nr:hypothetical protein [Pelagibaca sp.]